MLFNTFNAAAGGQAMGAAGMMGMKIIGTSASTGNVTAQQIMGSFQSSWGVPRWRALSLAAPNFHHDQVSMRDVVRPMVVKAPGSPMAWKPNHPDFIFQATDVVESGSTPSTSKPAY